MNKIGIEAWMHAIELKKISDGRGVEGMGRD